MLGDFSFGGVSKQQACAWAFELITKEFKLPLDRLYFTVFTEDDETHDVWRSLALPRITSRAWRGRQLLGRWPHRSLRSVLRDLL